MSIQTTKTVSRSWALERIALINSLLEGNNFLELERTTFESEGQDIAEVFGLIANYSFSLDRPDLFTNRMLAEILDWPFFRESLFDNYFVKDD